MHEKIMLVTGATDGIGKQTALELAEANQRIIIHGRDANRCESAKEEIIALTGNSNIYYYESDFSSINSVIEFAGNIDKDFSHIDVLINNAGVYKNTLELTSDGNEMTFAVNHLAHFILTLMLIEKLAASGEGRIINVSSVAHTRGTIDFDNLNAEKSFSPYGSYAQSKLANVLFTYELARRISKKGVTVNALHPGVIGTKLLREGFGISGAGLKEGAATSVYLASSKDVKGVTGKYFDKNKEVRSSKASYDRFLQKRLWERSLEMTGLNDPVEF